MSFTIIICHTKTEPMSKTGQNNENSHLTVHHSLAISSPMHRHKFNTPKKTYPFPANKKETTITIYALYACFFCVCCVHKIRVHLFKVSHWARPSELKLPATIQHMNAYGLTQFPYSFWEFFFRRR